MNALLSAIIAIVGATVYTGDGAPLENATVLIEGSKIAAVGVQVSVPADARVVDAAGLVVTPGFIDAYSRVALDEISQETTSVEGTAGPKGDPLRAALRVADTFNAASQSIAEARQGGITSAIGVPVEGIVAGQSAWFEFGSEPRVLESPVALHVLLGASPGLPGSRSIKWLHLRRALDDAVLYRRDPAAFKRRALRQLAPGAADLAVLARAIDGTLPVVFTLNRAADIRTALAISKQYGLWTVLVGAAEGWVVATEIAAAKVPVLVNPFDNLPRDFDSLEARADNAELLRRAGVVVAFTLEGDAHQAARLRQAAGIAVANGFPHDSAIAALTRIPAEIFGNAELGTLRPGDRADLVLWTGDPLELGSWVQDLYVGGEQIDLTTRRDLLTERYKNTQLGLTN